MKKILIIDDSPLLNLYFERLLIPDIEIEWKQILDPYKTKDVINEYKPDVIILDVKFNLPIDGLEIGKFINKNYNIPIIYHSSVNEKEAKDIIDQINPYAFLIKNVDNSRSFSTRRTLLYSLLKHILV